MKNKKLFTLILLVILGMALLNFADYVQLKWVEKAYALEIQD